MTDDVVIATVWIVGFIVVAVDARGWPLPAGERLAIIASVALGGVAFSTGGSLVAPHVEVTLPSPLILALLGGYAGVATWKRLRGLRHVETADAFARGIAFSFAVHALVLGVAGGPGVVGLVCVVVACVVAVFLQAANRLRGLRLFTMVAVVCAFRVFQDVAAGNPVLSGFFMVAISASVQVVRRSRGQG